MGEVGKRLIKAAKQMREMLRNGELGEVDPDKLFPDENMPEGYAARREALRKK